MYSNTHLARSANSKCSILCSTYSWNGISALFWRSLFHISCQTCLFKSFLFCIGANQQSGNPCLWQSIGERWRQTESCRQDPSKAKSQKQELHPGNPLLLRPQHPLLTRPSVTFLFQHYINIRPLCLLLYQVFLILVYKNSSIIFVPSV